MKAQQYADLVAERKGCRQCAGLANPSEIEEGRYDSDHIGPWSRWQGNLDASLLLVAQDWGDTGYFIRQKGWERPTNPTNRTLVELLDLIGLPIGRPGETVGQNIVFFTNAVLCLKEGGLQGRVQKQWFLNCAPYLRRQIDIVRPKVVVALGKHAFESVLHAFCLKPAGFRQAVEDAGGILLPTGSRLFAVYHCGARVLNTHRPLKMQREDWQRIGRALRGDPPPQARG
jgi:DNA polymerase